MITRCLVCNNADVIVNKHKRLCKECALLALTKSWVLGVTVADIQKCLIEKIKKGYNLREIALDCDVTEQTLVLWFKKFFDGKTFKEVKRNILR